MNIVVAGLGKVGLEVVEQLSSEGHSVTVIDTDAKKVDSALGLHDIGGVVGSATDFRVLLEANISEADLLIAFTGNDEINLMACLLSKKLGAKSTIARARNPEYREGIYIVRDDLGLSMCINPEMETAREIARILRFPLAKNVEPFAKGKVEMIQYVLKDSDPLCGRTVNSVFSRLKNPVLVCAVLREDRVIIPYGDFIFSDGDELFLVSSPDRLSAFFREVGIRTTTVRDIIIIGGGRTSYYLAEQLRKERLNITIIEINKGVAEEISDLLPNVNVINGDGTDQQILAEEGLRDKDALCCMTGIDEENIIASMYANSVCEDIKTITKVSRSELTYLGRSLGLDSIVTPKKIAANLILQYVRAKQNSEGSNVLTLYKLADGKAEALELMVTEESSLVGITLKDLSISNDVILAGINRKGKIIIPRGSDALEAGDTVIVVTTRMGLDNLEDITE
ncbi:MAG: Trk system potassium transporter TrkA [Clostridia bacterium]|nr:Trk system potassium transporter TrkA [Clostridia bacterium]